MKGLNSLWRAMQDDRRQSEEDGARNSRHRGTHDLGKSRQAPSLPLQDESSICRGGSAAALGAGRGGPTETLYIAHAARKPKVRVGGPEDGSRESFGKAAEPSQQGPWLCDSSASLLEEHICVCSSARMCRECGVQRMLSTALYITAFPSKPRTTP